ncbi:transposase [Photorhabdus khanii]|uniref:Transposase n=1 Tax=Photorhabdus khanii TaxID=1004150 RepID=A0A7C9GKA8_9GAMM|nr:transposase [Photorhabdus khanii]
MSRKNNRAEVLDFTCRRGRFEFRVIRRWFAQEKRFCFWLTNLPPSHFTADDIMAVYRCRWQVELLFKELKSHTHWTSFATGQKAIAEGLIWASLLALIVWRGGFCLQFPFSRQPKMLMSGYCRYWARLFIMPGRK